MYILAFFLWLSWMQLTAAVQWNQITSKGRTVCKSAVG